MARASPASPQAATTSTSVQWKAVPRNPACIPSAKCLTGKIRAIQRIQAGEVDFGYAKFSESVVFRDAEFSGGKVGFGYAEFSGGEVDFYGAKFSGGEVSFTAAVFSGSEVDFSGVRRWSQPPVFDWEDAPPAGVMLPVDADATPA
jgi:hypothetical protein